MKKLFIHIIFLMTLGTMGTVYAQQPTTASDTNTQAKARILNEVNILGNQRAADMVSTLETRYDRETLDQQATAGSVPYMLDMEASVVASSENGLAGNTSLRIRGVDATRINVNLNGISLNGAESHNFTWVNILNLGGMTESLTVQRGVGASSGGAATFGGAINMKTLNPRADSYASAELGYGSWNTLQYGFTGGTGISKKGYSLDVKYSDLQSDGFVRGGYCDHKSLFLSGTRYGKKSILKAIAIIGNHNTGITYMGASAEQLDLDPTYNPAGAYTDPVTGALSYYDHNGILFFQRRYQLLYSYQLNDFWNLTAVADLTKGDGYEETYKDNAKASKYFLTLLGSGDTRSDFIIRKEMHNASYTANLSANYQKHNTAFSLGENFMYYKGNHFSNMTWCELNPAITEENPYQWYENWGDKIDATTYAKLHYSFSNRTSLCADLQYRFVQFAMEGFDSDSSNLAFSENYPFFNPKVGVNHLFNDHERVYFVAGISHREPTRADIKDRLNSIHFSDTVKAEALLDLELGYQVEHGKFLFLANGYAMLYKDQLTPSGDLSSTAFDVLMENVDRSYRLGVELMASYKCCSKFRLDGNLTLSRNKILDYTFTDFRSGIDTVMHVVTATTDLSYSPNIVGSLAANYEPVKDLCLQLNAKYVGEMYADNTSRQVNLQEAYWLLNFRGGYTWHFKGKEYVELQLSVNNILNKNYRMSASTRDFMQGGVCYTSRTYYQQPGINFVGRVVVGF